MGQLEGEKREEAAQQQPDLNGPAFESKPADPAPEADRSKALAVIGDLAPEIRGKLNLPKSTLSTAITLFRLDRSQLEDIAHLAESGVPPLNYLALRQAGAEHHEVMFAANVAESITEAGRPKQAVRVRELVNEEALERHELSQLDSQRGTISLELLTRFAEQFGFNIGPAAGHRADIVGGTVERDADQEFAGEAATHEEAGAELYADLGDDLECAHAIDAVRDRLDPRGRRSLEELLETVIARSEEAERQGRPYARDVWALLKLERPD